MNFDVVIVGGGLVGASLALALRETGLRIALVDAQAVRPDTDAWDSRVYAISPGSRAFLASCGAWAGLDVARLAAIEEMHIFGAEDGPELDFSAYDAGLPELAVIAESGRLQSALWRALADEPAITVIAPVKCASLRLTPEEAVLELGDGKTLCASLVVGADGGESWVRAQAQIGVDLHVYHQRAVVANFSGDIPHRGVAYQWFRSDGVLALLPLPGARASMVWSCANPWAARLTEMSAAELAHCVTEATGGVMGELEVITPAAAFPLRLQRVERLVAPRAALVGDAAHLVHPLAGQGVNLGFRDARVLAEVLAQRGLETDCGDYALLRRYERARREDIAAMQWATDGLQKVFSSPYRGLAQLGNLALRIANSQQQLKNLLVQHAVG